MKVSDDNANKVKEHLTELVNDGNFCQSGFWKLKNKLCPKPYDPPMAKKDLGGNLVSAPDQLKILYAQTYEYECHDPGHQFFFWKFFN